MSGSGYQRVSTQEDRPQHLSREEEQEEDEETRLTIQTERNTQLNRTGARDSALYSDSEEEEDDDEEEPSPSTHTVVLSAPATTLASVANKPSGTGTTLSSVTPLSPLTAAASNTSSSSSTMHSGPSKSVDSSPLTSSSSSASPSSPFSLTLLRMNEPNRRVVCSPHDSIAQLKAIAYPNEIKANKLIRMIYLGRVLQDNQIIADLKIEKDHCIHVLITDRLEGQQTDGSSTSSGEQLHHPDPYSTQSSYPGLSYQQEGVVGGGPSSGSGVPLSAAGYASLEEGHYSDAAYIHTAEGAAIPIDSLYQEAVVVPEGTSKDFLIGFGLGLMLGFISCIWLWNATAPRKQRLGIFCGLLVNILIGNTMSRPTPTHSTSENGKDEPLNNPIPQP